jgi:hypothetical protein
VSWCCHGLHRVLHLLRLEPFCSSAADKLEAVGHVCIRLIEQSFGLVVIHSSLAFLCQLLVA